MKKQVMHVAIMDPSQSRKNILEATVASIQCLKNLERLRIIRKQKKVYKEELLKNATEINRLFGMLDMPRIDYEDKRIIKKIKKSLPKKEEVRHIKNKEIERLEDDIIALREKISNL